MARHTDYVSKYRSLSEAIAKMIGNRCKAKKQAFAQWLKGGANLSDMLMDDSTLVMTCRRWRIVPAVKQAGQTSGIPENMKSVRADASITRAIEQDALPQKHV